MALTLTPRSNLDHYNQYDKDHDNTYRRHVVAIDEPYYSQSATTATTTTKKKNNNNNNNNNPMDLVNVFLKMWDGKTLCCTIDPTAPGMTNIRILKNHILQNYPSYNNNTNIVNIDNNNTDDFYLVWKGKPLNDRNCDLIPWTTTNGCTIFVQYRNRGGCFIISFTIFCIIIAAIIGSTCTCGSSLLIIPVLLPFLFILPFFCL